MQPSVTAGGHLGSAPQRGQKTQYQAAARSGRRRTGLGWTTVENSGPQMLGCLGDALLLWPGARWGPGLGTDVGKKEGYRAGCEKGCRRETGKQDGTSGAGKVGSTLFSFKLGRK